MTDHPDYVVLRAMPGLPAGYMPPDLEGKWLDRRDARITYDDPTPGPGSARAWPTGRLETRDDDGAVAEVWEVGP